METDRHNERSPADGADLERGAIRLIVVRGRPIASGSILSANVNGRPESFERPHQVIVVGAGPVGLLLASFLGLKGVRVLLLEARTRPSESARAIGVSIPSLEIFERLGLSALLCAAGVAVPMVHMRSSKRRLGRIDFRDAGSKYQFVLSIPQGLACRIIERELLQTSTVDVRRGHTVESLQELTDTVVVSGRTEAGEPFSHAGRFLIGCDGADSVVREAAEIEFGGGDYADRFVMGDYVDRTGWGTEAHVFSTHRGSVESFPMPDGLRRYVLSNGRPADRGTVDLEGEIGARCGVRVVATEKKWESAFSVEHRIVRTYYRSRVAVAGDAAHLMSPIVGQNMNVGFADAEHLAEILPIILEDEARAPELLRSYDRIRRRAAKSATRRAWLMMRLATSGGKVWSLLRSAGMALMIFALPRSIIASLFSMTSIPYRNMATTRQKIRDLRSVG